MAGELQAAWNTGKTCYFIVRNRTGSVWNGSAFATYATASYATYVISATEQGTAGGFYTATFPASISAGVYSTVMKEQAGGSPAETDATVAVGEIQWNGTAQMPLSDVATSGQLSILTPIQIARGIQQLYFPLYFKSAADHITPFTSGVISGQIARDGGVFGPLQSGLVSERGLGWYDVTLTSGDLDARTIKLMFTGRAVSGGTCDPLPFSFILQRSSGGA